MISHLSDGCYDKEILNNFLPSTSRIYLHILFNFLSLLLDSLIRNSIEIHDFKAINTKSRTNISLNFFYYYLQLKIIKIPRHGFLFDNIFSEEDFSLYFYVVSLYKQINKVVSFIFHKIQRHKLNVLHKYKSCTMEA